MTVASIEYAAHELVFKNAFVTSGTQSHTRKVYYLKLLFTDRCSFYGECSPLPQFGSEDYPEVDYELERLSRLKNLTIDAPVEEVEKAIKNISKLPVVRFAFEQALFQWLGQNSALPSPLTESKIIHVNGLEGLLEKDAVIENVSQLYTKGYTTIKLKAGRDNFEDDLDIISEIRNRFGGDIKLRLDINGKWNLEEAKANINLLTDFNIEYIEQPVKDTEELIKLSDTTDIPLAADESIRSIKDAEHIINSSRVKYLVLKPALLGGYFNTARIIEAAKAKNVQVVISSSLESNLGRRHLTAITAALGNKTAHGLGTSGLFSNEIVEDTFPVNNGKINYSPELIQVDGVQNNLGFWTDD